MMTSGPEPSTAARTEMPFVSNCWNAKAGRLACPVVAPIATAAIDALIRNSRRVRAGGIASFPFRQLSCMERIMYMIGGIPFGFALMLLTVGTA